MAVKRTPYYEVNVEDKPGILAKFARDMKEARVNFRGLWGFGIGSGQAKIYCIPERFNKFLDAARRSGLSPKEGTAFYITGSDKLGALCNALDSVAHVQVNIHALDAIGVGGRFGAYIWVEDKDVETLTKALKAS